MEFNTPTNKTELYETLNSIYFYYRLRVDEYNGVTLSPLDLTRMTFNSLSDNELREKAAVLLSSSQDLRLMNYLDKIKEKMEKVDEDKAAEEAAKNALIEEAGKTFLSAKEALKSRAIKTGTESSGIYAEKLSVIEKEKGEKIAKITAESVAKIAALSEKKAALLSLFNSAEEKFSEICEKEIEAKFTELKDEQEKTARYVFEYNNALDEKEQRYENSRAQTVASMQLRHLEIRVNGMTKDELVEHGYYNDVIKCVKDYYDTMTPAAAFSDIRSEPRLAIYLDDYYTDVVYFYKVNAE